MNTLVSCWWYAMVTWLGRSQSYSALQACTSQTEFLRNSLNVAIDTNGTRDQLSVSVGKIIIVWP